MMLFRLHQSRVVLFITIEALAGDLNVAGRGKGKGSSLHLILKDGDPSVKSE
jgi:hypothetical protein